MKRTALTIAGILSIATFTSVVEAEDFTAELASNHPLRQGTQNTRPIIGVLTQPIDDGMK
jgi:hypothetical protein